MLNWTAFPRRNAAAGPHPAMFDRGRYVFAQVYPSPAHFRATAVGIQAVKTTSALIAMSSSCIKTFLVKHHNLGVGGGGVSVLNQAGLE